MPGKTVPGLWRTRRDFLGVLVGAVLLAAFGLLEGCKSEKPSSESSEAMPVQTPTNLGDMSVKGVSQGWGTLHFDLNVTGTPLSIGGKGYKTGLGTHAISRIEISFPANYKTFTGSCGVDDAVENRGSIVCKILDGQKVLFESPVMKGKMKAADFSVPVNALTGLVLIVENGGDDIDSDHADWVNLSLK